MGWKDGAVARMMDDGVGDGVRSNSRTARGGVFRLTMTELLVGDVGLEALMGVLIDQGDMVSATTHKGSAHTSQKSKVKLTQTTIPSQYFFINLQIIQHSFSNRKRQHPPDIHRGRRRTRAHRGRCLSPRRRLMREEHGEPGIKWRGVVHPASLLFFFE